MSAQSVGHQSISASAGSGKTFALAHRYLRLLGLGVAPDRICALTFSRKAAGEIFDSIVENLCSAAVDDAAAAGAAARIGCPDVTTGDFAGWLREFIENLHRSHIGTLDSFIIGIIRSFPTEVGIPIDFDVMDGDGVEARDVRRDVLDRVLRPGGMDEAARHDFLDAFKLATFGREEKGLIRLLERFVEQHRQQLLKLPGMQRWGDRETIWGDAWSWPDAAEGMQEVADALREAVDASELGDAAAEIWFSFCDAVGRHRGGVPLSEADMRHMKKLLGALQDLEEGNAAITVARKKTPLDERLCSAALDVVRHFIAVEVYAALQQTAGIHRVLSAYEQGYQEFVRRSGRLTFEDAQYLLAPAADGSDGLVPSRLQGEEGRLYIDYRLDSQLDHWLLDEFQDTSDLQWSVLANLVDEIIQDPSGRRSFFYVGDVKQAIYGWRGGNARLFGMILDRYGREIERAPLNTSYRSCEPVVDTVNSVFDSLDALELSPRVVSNWQRYWAIHESAPGFVPETGYAVIVEPPCDQGETKPGEQDRYQLAAELINEIQPQRRGLTTAVLVRTNDQGHAVVDTLRRCCPEVTVVHEGHAAITDCAAVKLLLAVLRYAAHPGDSMARAHLQASPLRGWMQQHGVGVQQLPLRILEEVQYGGLTEFVEQWSARLAEAGAVDDFARVRLEDLAAAAAEFEARGDRDIDSFHRYVESHTVREEAADNVVRVMTVHQSKGLGFDVVVLPALSGRGGVDSGGRTGVLLKRDEETGRPGWALRMPLREVSNADSVLAAALQEFDDEDTFESLCVLYVAMTRAKQALYMVTSFGGKSAKALNEAALVKMQLCGEKHPIEGAAFPLGGAEYTCLYESGTRSWYESVPMQEQPEPVEAAAIPSEYSKQESSRIRLGHVLPSGSDTHVGDASGLFSLETREILDFGTAIHRMFEEIEWIEDADAEAIVESLLPGLDADEDVRRDSSAQFQSAVGAGEVRDALARPDEDVDLWRERRFDIVLDGNLVTGTFDRVVVHRDSAGVPARAEILDYKSNRVQTEEEIRKAADGYVQQLTVYRRALARILHLDDGLIRCRLVFTRPGRVVELDL